MYNEFLRTYLSFQGNIPAKESRKREHPPEEDKSEKLAKITVKFSKEGGHPHIVQQNEQENLQKRPHEDQNHLEKNKKQKVDVVESIISTRSKQKEHAVDGHAEVKESDPSSPVMDTQSDNSKSKQPQTTLTNPDNPGHGLRGKHKDQISNSPMEAKRSKLKESRHKTNLVEPEKVEINNPNIVSPVASPLDTAPEATALVYQIPAPPAVTPVSTPEIGSVASTPGSEASTPSSTNTTPQPKKRGRPRKVIFVL